MTIMFLLFPYICIFSFFLFLRTFIILSAPNWLTAWLSIELNLLRVIPLIISSKILQELESTTKYFFAQRLGRILILFRAFLFTPWVKFLILLGILLKLGLAPLHIWLPATMAGLSWEICILISTWQKFPLLCLLCIITPNYPSLFLYVGTLSVLVGGLIGLNQTQLRVLLSYSSIAHTGWVVALFSLKPSAGWSYFLIYVIITISIISIIKQKNALFFWSLTPSSLVIFLLLLSLGGLPPLSGFAIKLGAIKLLSSTSIPLVLLIIIGSLLSLYYYLNLALTFIFRGFSSPRIHALPISLSSSILISLSLFRFIIFGNFFLIYCALTGFDQPQRYWHALLYSRNLIWPQRNFNKPFNSSWIGPTRISLRQRPVI